MRIVLLLLHILSMPCAFSQVPMDTSTTLVKVKLDIADVLWMCCQVDEEQVLQEEKAARSYISSRLIITANHIKYDKQYIYASFIVDSKGRIKDVEVSSNINDRINGIVIDLIENMPPWPPSSEGRNVLNKRVTMPILVMRE